MLFRSAVKIWYEKGPEQVNDDSDENSDHDAPVSKRPHGGDSDDSDEDMDDSEDEKESKKRKKRKRNKGKQQQNSNGILGFSGLD